MTDRVDGDDRTVITDDAAPDGQHHGRIIVNGTLTELKQLLPSAKVEYVEKQPTLEDVFFAIVGDDGKHDGAGNDRSAATDE